MDTNAHNQRQWTHFYGSKCKTQHQSDIEVGQKKKGGAVFFFAVHCLVWGSSHTRDPAKPGHLLQQVTSLAAASIATDLLPAVSIEKEKAKQWHGNGAKCAIDHSDQRRTELSWAKQNQSIQHPWLIQATWQCSQQESRASTPESPLGTCSPEHAKREPILTWR